MRWGRNSRPLVIAHRGASADAVENTRAAFRLAREQSADGVELDVLRCGSGEVVVVHNDDLVRLAADCLGAERRCRALNLNADRQLVACLLRWQQASK